MSVAFSVTAWLMTAGDETHDGGVGVRFQLGAGGRRREVGFIGVVKAAGTDAVVFVDERLHTVGRREMPGQRTRRERRDPVGDGGIGRHGVARWSAPAAPSGASTGTTWNSWARRVGSTPRDSRSTCGASSTGRPGGFRQRVERAGFAEAQAGGEQGEALFAHAFLQGLPGRFGKPAGQRGGQGVVGDHRKTRGVQGLLMSVPWRAD
ncbi:MAG: hypothetical protein WDM96_14035 [Lacunisphaera sp.]